jgi:hypothetical protein
MWLWSYVWLRSYARLRIKASIPLVCLTPVGRHDSSHLWDSGRTSDPGQKMKLWSYAQLQTKEVAPVICATTAVCPIPIGRCDSSRMPDSDQKAQLQSFPDSCENVWHRSCVRPWSKDVAPVVCSTLVVCATLVVCSCHTRFLRQNQVLIVCMTQDQLFHTYGQKCSQITKCHEYKVWLLHK